ncbi:MULTISPECIES: IclR family transcriptional regulator [Bacillaceae]|uniref:IclR family transcriptional regulator n=1 Tax=Bacillaceae TaxID=186817 RepID=UPI00300046B2
MICIIPTNKKTSVLQSVQNGLQILKLFTIEKPVWGITEIANALEMNKSSVSRLVSDLTAESFLQKEGDKYSPGFSLLSISGVITSHLEIHRESKDILKKLVSDLGESAHVAILEGIEITYVHKVECTNPVPLLSSIGKKNPVSCTSAGKVLLAFGKKNTVDSIIREGLLRMGLNSQTDPEQLIDQLRQIKEQGYSICIDEMHDNIVSIAAPVRDYTGEVVAAVSVVGTRDRIQNHEIKRFTGRVMEAANEVSLRLGNIPEKEWSSH